MRKKGSSSLVLGVMVTDKTIHAVLLRSKDGEASVIRRFTRQRSTGDDLTGGEAALPGTQGEDGDDFTIQFGDDAAGGDDDMFLGTEFGDTDVDVAGFEAGGEATTPEAPAFVLELGDILAECRDAGYEEPVMTFCTRSQNVRQLELHAEEDATDKQLHARLTEQHALDVDKERVAFLPMTPTEEELGRYLALVPKTGEPVTPTLRTMHGEQEYDLPSVRFLDTEVSLYGGLSRLVAPVDAAEPGVSPDEAEEPADEARNTLIVRAGTDDTLVAFLRGRTLHHCEKLRSLTAYDAAETICSRVLLLQDEHGAGEVQHVLLLSEEDEHDLVDSFEMFFPEAQVEPLRETLPATDPHAVDQEPTAGNGIAAVGVALRLINEEQGGDAFNAVNMLPKRLLRRRFRMPISWQNIAALAVLFITVFFFTGRFLQMEGDISEAQRKLDRYSGTVSVEPSVLQARIDSLQGTAQGMMKALDVLDGLLVGSNKWSRALEKTSRHVAAVSGIWIESWAPQGDHLQLQGNAVARSRIVDLAERVDGAIQKLTFSEIRTWPVYSFTLRVPLSEELPRAARYLRQRVAVADSTAPKRVPTTPTSLDEGP